jgi:DNA-binding response OmpR family regulator
LVVEDDPFILMDACDIVGEAGFRCLEAKDGDIAKKVLQDNAGAITLLFTDVDIPGSTNGFALAHFAAEH